MPVDNLSLRGATFQSSPEIREKHMKSILMPLAALVLSAPAALALEASVSKEIAAPPAAVWAKIGDFCGVGKWHPAVSACETTQANGALLRHLTLKDGAKLVEKQIARDEAKMSYAYTLESGPLPVSGYASSITVSAKGNGSVIEWKGSFSAKGMPDAETITLIKGIYAAGLDSLATGTGR